MEGTHYFDPRFKRDFKAYLLIHPSITPLPPHILTLRPYSDFGTLPLSTPSLQVHTCSPNQHPLTHRVCDKALIGPGDGLGRISEVALALLLPHPVTEGGVQSDQVTFCRKEVVGGVAVHHIFCVK